MFTGILPIPSELFAVAVEVVLNIELKYVISVPDVNESFQVVA